MTREQAVDKYLKSRGKSEKVIKRLMLWDENKTSRENCIAVGLPRNHVGPFTRRYGLLYKMDGRGRPRVAPETWRYKAMRILRGASNNWSINEIAAALQVSRQYVEQTLQNGGGL